MSAYLAKLPSQPNIEGLLSRINSLRLGFETPKTAETDSRRLITRDGKNQPDDRQRLQFSYDLSRSYKALRSQHRSIRSLHGLGQQTSAIQGIQESPFYRPS